MRHDIEGSFDDFAAAAMPRLRHLAYAWCHDWHHSDDVVQDTMERLYAAWPRVRRDGQEYPYARTILIRRLISENRRAWRRHETTTLDTSDGRTTQPHPGRRSTGDEEAEATIERMDALGLLAQLPPRQQAVAILRFLEDLPVAEVADLLQCSEGTVKSQAHYARRYLQQHLTDPDPRDHPTSLQVPAHSGKAAPDVASPDGARP